MSLKNSGLISYSFFPLCLIKCSPLTDPHDFESCDLKISASFSEQYSYRFCFYYLLETLDHWAIRAQNYQLYLLACWLILTLRKSWYFAHFSPQLPPEHQSIYFLVVNKMYSGVRLHELEFRLYLLLGRQSWASYSNYLSLIFPFLKLCIIIAPLTLDCWGVQIKQSM